MVFWRVEIEGRNIVLTKKKKCKTVLPMHFWYHCERKMFIFILIFILISQLYIEFELVKSMKIANFTNVHGYYVNGY